MITALQIRMARAALNWSFDDLAKKTGLSRQGLINLANEKGKPQKSTNDTLIKTFEDNGIMFIGNTGVKKRTNEVRTLKGAQGFRDFMDDVYDVTKEVGGEICVFNVDEKNWIKWMGQEEYDDHAARMKTINKKYNFKIIVEEGDWFFIASEIAEYKWFPKALFNRQSFYIYGNKAAFINFLDNDVIIFILGQPQFAEGLKVLFDIAWDNVAQIPKKRGKTK